MNVGQKVILAVGGVIIVVMAVFPPWLYIVDEHYEKNSLSAEAPAGYRFLFSPPPLPSYEDRSSFLELGRLTYQALRRSGYPRLDYGRLLVQWLGVIIVTGGSVYFLRFHPQASPRNLFLIAILPLFISGLSFLALRTSQEVPLKPSTNPPMFIPYSEVEIFDATLQLRSPESTFSGRIRNRSNRTVTEIKLNISLLDGSQEIDGTNTTVALEVPPGEVRSFTKTVYGLREKEGWRWTYRIVEVRGQNIPPVSLGAIIVSEAFKSLSSQDQCKAIGGYVVLYGAPNPFPVPQFTLEECKRLGEEVKDPSAKPPGEKRDGR